MRLGNDETDYYVAAIETPGASAGAQRPEVSETQSPGGIA
jgi:hypothetical protein